MAAQLEESAAGAPFLLGLNLARFDRPHLQAISPNLRLHSPADD